jgi:hypothetical protein
MTGKPLFGLRPSLVLALLAALAAVGCGGGKPTVRGKVTYRGTPLTMGNVTLFSADGKIVKTAQIQEDGTYQIPDAPTGHVLAAVVNLPPVGARGGPPLIGAPNDEETRLARAIAARYLPTPPHYADPKTSGLSFDVPRRGGPLDIALR